jgi:putative ABC transport system substrate-binding protein
VPVAEVISNCGPARSSVKIVATGEKEDKIATAWRPEQRSMSTTIRRREVLVGLVGATVASPRIARGQPAIKRVGVQLNLEDNDVEGQQYVTAFEQSLTKLGWTPGHNLQIDYRRTGGDAARIRLTAAELIALKPDVLLTVGGSQVGPLQNLTSTLPIVFVQVADPVGGGFVDSLALPGRNATGFTVFEFGVGAKWLAILKEAAPSITRVVILRDPANPSGTGLFAAAQTVAPNLGIEVSPLGLREDSQIERGLGAFARGGLSDGVIVTPSGLALARRETIISLANRFRMPAIYPFRYFMTDGGLISYGPDVIEEYQQAAGYIDRILKGEKPANMPVQAPTKYQLGINLKTAKTIGLQMPQSLITRADEMIE